MKRLSAVLFLLVCQLTSAQTLSDKQKHDLASEIFSDVLFDSKSRLISDRLRAFEDQQSIKLGFRVEDASLDQLGGLSEHLFKIFQSITSPYNTNAKTITGEFSMLQDGVLDAVLKYKSLVTSDVAACRLPPADSRRIDSLYNKNFANSFTGITVTEAPAVLDDFYMQAAFDYEGALNRHYDCPGLFDANAYAQHVANTRSARAAGWASDAGAIRLNLSASMGALENSATGGTPPNNGNTGVNMNVDLDRTKGQFIINLNKVLNNCTEEDMETRCRILFKKTGINYFFVTQTLGYYIPLDSLETFKEDVVREFETANANKNLIIALYLNMQDPGEFTERSTLLVYQNGTWLSKADIDFARYNNSGNYKKNCFNRYTNLYRNIPKPLVLCYQVAKVNGMLTTSYITKGEHVKGKDQIMYHSFKVDRAFGRIKQLQTEIEQAEEGYRGVLQRQELRNRIRIEYLNSAKKAEFDEADQHFKDIHLQNKVIVEAAALKYLQDKYGCIGTDNEAAKALLNSVILPTDMRVGTCKTSEDSDVIGDLLSVTSLILTPVGLDIVPDALSVIYYGNTGQTLEMSLALGSLVMPGNLNVLKKPAGTLVETLRGIEKGEQLIKEGSNLMLVTQEVNQISTIFRIKPSDIDLSLSQKIVDKQSEVQFLLSGDAVRKKIYTNVADKLPEEKRLEFVKKFLDDVEFRNKVVGDADEVLRWGGEYWDYDKIFKAGTTKNSILAISKGNRPQATTYLVTEYTNFHLANFESGGSFIVSKSSLDTYGRDLVGRPDGQFIMCKREMDELIKKANGDVSIIENELGIPKGAWQGQELIRVDVSNPGALNLRIPSGNESGVNELWIPGGKLPTGYFEAVVNQIPKGAYSETLINLK